MDGSPFGMARRLRLVAEPCGNRNLVTALGTTAAENSGSGLGLHAAQEAVNFAATATVRLKGTLGHSVVLLISRLPTA